MRGNRSLAPFIRASIFVSCLVIGAVGGSAIADVATRFTPADRGDPTYELRDFQIQYPFEERTAEGTTVEDPSRVGVRWASEWANEAYPGPADCLIIVHDANGDEVGRDTIEYDSLQRSTDLLPSFHGIPVSGEPDLASGTCSSGRYRSEGGYDFENLHTKRFDRPTGPPGTTIEGTVRWQGGRPALTRACVATLTLDDGTQRRIDFTLDAPPGRPLGLLNVPDVPAASVTDVDVSCRPFTGE